MITVNIPAFIRRETWDGFTQMRRLKGQRAPWTDFAARRLIAKLEAFNADGWDADYLLAEAAERGWSSVFMVADCPRIRPARQETPHNENPPIEDPVMHARISEKLAATVAKLKRVA